MTKMMRITQLTAKNLEELVKILGKSKQSIMEEAVDNFLREEFFKKVNKEYEKLKVDPLLSDVEAEELSEWDQALKDELEEYD